MGFHVALGDSHANAQFPLHVPFEFQFDSPLSGVTSLCRTLSNPV